MAVMGPGGHLRPTPIQYISTMSVATRDENKVSVERYLDYDPGLLHDGYGQTKCVSGGRGG